jgi:transcriptional regulator with XRE-family HTH domain
MVVHRPLPAARRQAGRIAAKIGTDIGTSRAELGLRVEQVAERAQVAPSTVLRVIGGDAGVHLDTLCAVARAVGLNLGVKAYPGLQPRLRDTGQLRMAETLIRQAHRSWRPSLELVVGDPYGRAADLVFFGPDEIIHAELERHIVDFQAQLRAASVKRQSLQQHHHRPVRLILIIEDTPRNRSVVAAQHRVVSTALAATSRDIFRSVRSGSPLAQDGLLWIRSWSNVAEV